LVAVAAAALVVIGIVLLTRRDSGAQLSPSSSLAQTLQDATPTQPNPNTLVFSGISEPGYSYDLYLVLSDGTGLKRLAAGPGNEEHASWSPDGTRIVYTSSEPERFSIWVMNADGSEKRYLGEGASPSWSPDGKQILYDRVDIDRLSVMNADGSGRRLLGVGAPFWPRFATWAPDGKIVFVRIRASGGWMYGGERPSLGGDLYAVNPDGSGLERLTKGARLASPSVSPDGSTIAAYARRTDRLIAMPYRGDGPVVTLLDRASFDYFIGGGIPIARWTPDGKKLVLGSDNPSGGSWVGKSLYVVNADGCGLTRIPGLTRALDPDWRPEDSSSSSRNR
jgi:Tol biopolymer transport system component